MADHEPHRSLHDKGPDGRSREIESYIRRSFAFFVEALGTLDDPDAVFLDIGADYGFALDLASESGLFREAVGIEPFPSELALARDDIIYDTLALSVPRLRVDANYYVFLNHVWEHLPDPIGDLKALLGAVSVRAVFLATPDARVERSRYVISTGGHLWTFTPDYFHSIFPRIFGLEMVGVTTCCLRNDWDEIWGVYRGEGA